MKSVPLVLFFLLITKVERFEEMGCGSVSGILPQNLPPLLNNVRNSIRNHNRQQFENHESNVNGLTRTLPFNSSSSYQVQFVDGTVSSPFPSPVIIPNVSLWEFLEQVTQSVIGVKGIHFDWMASDNLVYR